MFVIDKISFIEGAVIVYFNGNDYYVAIVDFSYSAVLLFQTMIRNGRAIEFDKFEDMIQAFKTGFYN
jgi:hypothetical protein